MSEQEMVLRAYNAFKQRKSALPGKFDSAGRWYPSEDWEASCCSSVRYPSRKWPYSLLKHCISKKHIKTIFEENSNSHKIIEQAAKLADLPEPPKRACSNGFAYKAVAYINGRCHSIFDGSEYIMGEERKEAARQQHSGGFYVYETIDAAKKAQVPSASINKDIERVIVKCEVGGSYCRYGNKLSFSRIKPVEILFDI